MLRRAIFLVAAILLLRPYDVEAGPPYLSDDPEPTDYGHFEIYAFGLGAVAQDGMEGETGIDFNYGGAPDLQLTAVLPLAYDAQGHTGLGNIELAAKYRFLHQNTYGWDVSVFPRVLLPSASHSVGNNHFAVLMPVWVQRDFGKWSLFGGGGCVFNQSGDSRNFCLGGVALTRELTDGLRLGAEVFRQGSDSAGGQTSTAAGFGITYDLNEHYHLLGYWGPGLQNVNETVRQNWYSALLFTF